MGSTKAGIELKTYQKMILGAIGALTPSLLNLYAADIGGVFSEPPPTPYILGYAVRAAILMFYGALIVYFNKDEVKPMKIFQLGAAAPALITIMLGTGDKRPSAKHIDAALLSRTSINWVIPTAQAQQPLPMVKEFKMQEENAFSQFWKGFWGEIIEENTYTVTVNKDIDWEMVKQEYYNLQQEYPDIKVEVYHSCEWNDKYTIVLGTNLTEYEAMKLKNRGEELGLKDLKVVNLKYELYDYSDCK